ncbi:MULTISPECIES: histidine phosphatase family protein [Dethiosulfovibrio]|uniref:Histidine phosphatase family protein n=2 Tax=Dethiosulfovibrio TaxID=47054 RepID=A0ABS9EK97_9BACT|nr:MULTISPECIES: histidine phosphatase family protein [Dethiosulfovibrio]MCF4113960.1 histidine phosphatase family protein [Dethiosulfovibrio russensis]MCF4141627.1 histidine phosphatase family protein [Dethiosulfovibrio marinus]MCF4143956.1 histidine phosphatase family protein [Dethiosulfovibrio acidaminovorans]MEA3284130.1 histidine phosphatase family protein [Synergistota bacterium]
MDEKKLLLLRHGQTDWNIAFKYQGSMDIPLNETGELQAEKTADRLNEWVPDVCLVSPLLRAFRTAEIVSERWRGGPELSVMDDLREISFGAWEGMSVGEVMDAYSGDYESWRNDPGSWTPPGGEPFEKVRERAKRVVSRVLSCDAERVVAVTHGGLIRAIVASLFSLPDSSVWRFRLDNCAMVGVSFWRGSPSLMFFNDSLHQLMEAGTKLPLSF